MVTAETELNRYIYVPFTGGQRVGVGARVIAGHGTDGAGGVRTGVRPDRCTLHPLHFGFCCSDAWGTGIVSLT